MKTDNHNDWTDAFRESFPEEARPAAGGWEAVAGRMRRAAERRRAAVAAAAIALPLAAGLIFFPSRPDGKGTEIAVSPSPVIHGNHRTPSVGEPQALVADVTESVMSGPVAAISGSSLPSSIDRTIPSSPTQSLPSSPATEEVPPATGTVGQITHEPDTTPTITDTVTPVTEAVKPGSGPASLTQSDLPDLFAESGDAPARARRLAVGLGAAATAGGTPTTVTTTSMASGFATKASNAASNAFFNNTSGTFLHHKYDHDLPVSIGLAARYGLTDRLWLESGIEFTKLHSRLDDLHTSMLFVGIPLRVNYRLFSAGPFEAYAGLGGKAEKCLKATLGGMKVSEPQLQWSGSVLLGAQTRLTKKTWLYLQPDLTYYFTKTAMVSYRTENRLGLTINAGLRFDIASH